MNDFMTKTGVNCTPISFKMRTVSYAPSRGKNREALRQAVLQAAPTRKTIFYGHFEVFCPVLEKFTLRTTRVH